MIKEYLKFEESGLHVVFGITQDKKIRLLHFSHNPFCEAEMQEKDSYLEEGFLLTQVSIYGINKPYEKQGIMYVATEPGCALLYDGMTKTENEYGMHLEIRQKDEPADGTGTGIKVTTHWQFYHGIPIVRMWHMIDNNGRNMQTLDYVSSFSYLGLEKEGTGSSDDKMRLYIPHNGWQKEISWQEYSFAQLGLAQNQPHVFVRTSKTIDVTNTGHWSSKDYLPMGYVENTHADSSLFFQIEHNGSWHYEYGFQNDHIFLNVSGPTELQSHWFRDLQPGDSFTTVPVAVGVSDADFSNAMAQMTRYRRQIRRPNTDDEKLPVIFNDYMNCLFGDPTTEKEIPLIDAAAEAGAEYYVIDAGWYADGEWWSNVGEWKESRKRFPGGIREVTDYIRSKGMIAGVWLELEVMGIYCEMASRVPDNWFFVRHGKRVYDRSRYQLDFRNPEVIAYVTAVIDRMVQDYGVGYIKMDYNIEPGIGTELDCESVGEGMLEHERAYLKWLDGIFEKYPELVIENCSSGGLRMDYAMLQRYSIQSTSDQEDYINYATISANVPSALTPEQAAVWSYPLRDGTQEEVIYNMINALLCRIHQSGHLAAISRDRRELVDEGISYYKTIRGDIRNSLPYWPIGLAHTLDQWLCLVLYTDKKAYMAVWRKDLEAASLEDAAEIEIPVPKRRFGEISNLHLAYPADACSNHLKYEYKAEQELLWLRFEEPVMARLFEMDLQ